jgi:parallel beta-helix repeat protein
VVSALKKNIGLLVSFIALITLINVQSSAAQFYGSVDINADGTVEPATAPLQRIGDTYRLTGDVGSISVKRSNIVLDGNGNMLPGKISSYDDILERNITSLNSGGIFLDKVDNVTVKNLLIKDSKTGIYLEQSTNCVIANNTIVGTHALISQLQVTSGIFVWGGSNNVITGNALENNENGLYICYDSKNTVFRNTIINSTSSAIFIWNASGNILYCNNFIDNVVQVSVNEQSINNWDHGKKGNFWSDYNGSDSNGDGVGDTPYTIDDTQQDCYPLIVSFDSDNDTAGAPSKTEHSLILPFAIIGLASAIVIIGIVIYVRKYPN